MPFRVMVVEDEAVAAVGIRSMIQDAGHEVVGVARSGEEAIAMADESQLDAAIIDVKLPGLDGIEITRQLVDNKNLAVVIVSACADPELIEGAAAAGAFTYLLKPVSKEALCANLEVAAARAAQFADLRRETDDVKAALEVRKLSERAKHVLIGRLSLTEGEAYSHMRQKCRNQNKTMRQVSEEILAAEEVFLAGLAKEPPKKQDSPPV